MITWGFVCGYSDVVTVGSPFTMTLDGVLTTFTSTFIRVATAGNVVWLNASGVPQWTPNVASGEALTIGASKIVATATVNGVSRTTTATDMSWMASPQTV